jgi:hypothetical protein
MSNDIDITLSAHDKGAEQTLQKLQKENDKLTLKVEKLAQKSVKGSADSIKGFHRLNSELEKFGRNANWATKQASDGLGSATANAGRLLMQLTGISSATAAAGMAFRLLASEQAALEARQERKRLATLGPAQAVREAKLALEDDATLSKANLEDAVIKLAAETRAPAATVANTIGVASSAKGELSNANLLDAVKRALQIDPGKPEQAPILAASMLDLAKVSGSTDMRVNAGFLQNIGQASHVKNFEMIGDNLVPAINSLTKLGDTHEQAGELTSAMTQMLNEAEGRISATASLTMGEKLKQFFLSPATKGKHKGQLVGKDDEGEFVVPGSQFEALRGAKSTMERIGVMQESPELRRAFFGELKGHIETKARQSALALLRGDDVAMRALGQAQKVIRGTQTPEDRAFQANLFDSEVKGYESGKFQQALTAEQQSASNLETSNLKDQDERNKAIARKILKDTFEGTDTQAGINLPGVDSLSRGLRMNPLGLGVGGFEGKLNDGENPFQAAIDTLQQTRDELSAKEFNPFKGKWKPSAIGTPTDFQTIDSQIALLKQQQQAALEQNKKLDQQTQILREISTKLSPSAAAPQPYAPPAARNDRRFRFEQTGGF